MAINFNNDLYNQGLGNLNTGIMKTAGLLPEFMGGTSDEEDAAQDSLEQIQDLRINQMKGIPQGNTEAETQSIINDLQYTNPTKLEQYQNIEKQIQDIKNQNKDFQEFKDIGGLTANANNIMSDANSVTPNTPEISSEIMRMLKKQQNTPQYRIRDQLRRDFSTDGIPKDFFKGLRQAGSDIKEDFSGLTKGLGSIKNNYVGPAVKKGINWGKQLPGMAMGALSGVPGLGFLINNMRSDPRDQFLGDPYSMQNYKGPNYGYGNTLRHGNLTGQDQFGINTRSLLGDYQGHYGNFMNDYLAGNINKNKFNKNKFAFAQDVTGTADDSSNITGTPLITSTSIHQGPDTPSGGGNWGAAPGTPGAWSPGARDGGRMARGGIASLWPR